MKIRLGFVSNSSSCGFCLLGVYIDDTYDGEPLYSSIDALEDGDIEYREDSENGEVAVGMIPHLLDEEKSIKELKIIVANRINEVLKTHYNPEDISFVEGVCYC